MTETRTMMARGMPGKSRANPHRSPRGFGSMPGWGREPHLVSRRDFFVGLGILPFVRPGPAKDIRGQKVRKSGRATFISFRPGGN